MLNLCGFNRTHVFARQIPIKTVDGEVTSLSASPLLQLAGPEPGASEDNVKQRSPVRSPGSLHTSPSTQLTCSSPPNRLSIYRDPYSESSRLAPLASGVHMDTLDARKSDGRFQRESSGVASKSQFQLRDGNKPQSVVVAVDATRELTLAALEWALTKVVAPGDQLYLLGILHQINNPSSNTYNGVACNPLQSLIASSRAYVLDVCLLAIEELLEFDLTFNLST